MNVELACDGLVVLPANMLIVMNTAARNFDFMVFSLARA
jgi:hypothetical protein